MLLSEIVGLYILQDRKCIGIKDILKDLAATTESNIRVIAILMKMTVMMMILDDYDLDQETGITPSLTSFCF